MSDTLRRLARLHDIASEYHDIWGTLHRIGDRTLRALLSAMGVDASTDGAIDDALRESMRARWQRIVDAATVVREGTYPLTLIVRLPRSSDAAALRWRIIAEDGRDWNGGFNPEALPCGETSTIDGVAHAARTLSLAIALPSGYHRCSIIDGKEIVAEGSIIVTPARCYLPPTIANDGRVWGVAVQLYGLRSPTNWGSGDFSDLRALAGHCASAGASLVGVNPLHARNASDPAEASPYAASSRLFVDRQYLDVEAIADFAECDEARAIAQSPSFQSTLRALRGSELVDHAAAAAARGTVLERLYASFRNRHLHSGTPRAKAFRRFCADGGEALRRHTVFEALREHFHCADPRAWGWPVWPPEYRDPASPAVTRFHAEHAERVEFFAYLQWQADMQLAAAAERISAPESSIGLYRDLAVSVDRGGAEAWAFQHCFAAAASVGAPPDDFNLFGQDWGIAPWIPSRLIDAAYEPFIAILRANMRHAGALRIDHVMALSRLFWIPQGGRPADGAYVNYPMNELLGIAALESERNRCLVIGEDLGTVPDGVRVALKDAGVLSYDVFYFERRPSGEFKLPPEYDAQALAVATTHDLPTLAGWWVDRDLALREALGLFPDAAACELQRAARAQDRARLLRALDDARLLPEGTGTDPRRIPTLTPDLARAIHIYLARTPAKLVAVQLEDIVGALDQTNLPGTTSQHPNWRRKLPLSLEQLSGDRRFVELTRALRRERSRGH